MVEESGSSQEHPFAQKAREVAEGIKGSEGLLEAERAQLREDMREVKRGLVEAKSHLPGIVSVSAMSSGGIYDDYGAALKAYDLEHEVVLLNEPVIGEDGSVTYVVVTPAGFKGISFHGDADELLHFFKGDVDAYRNQGGAIYSDSLNGYYELPERDPRTGRETGKPVQHLFLGVLRHKGDMRGRAEFKGEELVDVPEGVVLRAYTNSQEVAAGKLKKVGNVDEQKQAIQGQRETGRRLLETMRQPPPPATGQS